MFGATWVGCGNDFVTPPPRAPRDSGGAGERVSTTAVASKAADPFVTGGTVRHIDFIRSGRVDPEQSQIEESAARTQAGYEKARLRFLPAETGSTPRAADASPDASSGRNKSQAEFIRSSIAGKPQAIIVDPDDPADKELARAIQEARAAKVPVVVLGKPIAGAGDANATGAAPMILVAPQAFAESAHRMVELAIRNLKNAKINPAGGALILISASSDRLAADRAAAIRQALEDANITSVAELRVPKEVTAAPKVLKTRLQEDPKPVMVFFVDSNGALAGREAASGLGEKRPFVRAGYTADEGRNRMVQLGEYAAVGEYEPTRLIRKAVTVAAAAAQRRESKESEEIVINILESPAGTGLSMVPPDGRGPPELHKKEE
jgi:ABC-type sugar transport system substrate-binding protein